MLKNRGSSIKFIYITSSSYSGSTLLSNLLNLHPDIATVGEMTGLISDVDFKNYRCSCGELIKNCSFYKRINQAFNEKGLNFNLRNFQTSYYPREINYVRRVLEYRSLRCDLFDKIRDFCFSMLVSHKNSIKNFHIRNKIFLDTVLALTGSNVFVDASKDPIRMKYLHQIQELDLYILHLTRDVRGVSNSYRKHHPERKNGLLYGAKKWKIENNEALRYIRSINETPSMHIKYELLCKNPLGVLNQIFQFVNIIRMEKIDLPPLNHHIIGNSMRLKKLNKIIFDEKWKEELNKHDLNLIIKIAGKLNRKFGYN